MHKKSTKTSKRVSQGAQHWKEYVLIRGEMHNRNGTLRTDFYERLAKIQDLAAKLGLIVQSIRRAAQCKSVKDFVDLQWTISNQ